MDYNFERRFNLEQNIWEIKVSGEVDIFNSSKFKESFLELISERPADLRIDCADLQYIDSTTLGVLVAVLKNVKSYNGTVTLAKVKPSIHKLFKITNLDKVFTIEGVSNE